MNYAHELILQDREIDGLNEQLEEDSCVLEHLQVQLLDERSKRADVERQNAMLQNQVEMLMNMLQEPNRCCAKLIIVLYLIMMIGLNRA